MADHSPFHAGELAIQERVGVRERAEAIGRRVIRDHLPDQHREFYPQLPMLLVGSVDGEGHPWASVLAGRPGFITTPDAGTLDVATRPIDGDPLLSSLQVGADLGMLGIQYHTRRRNRLSARVTSLTDEGMRLRVIQTFGNCPQYIQGREPELLPGIDRLGEARETATIDALDGDIAGLIEAADHFFIASHYDDGSAAVSNGADVSHRGGRPGFVRIDDERTLTFPDFRGNNHFNTFGNLALNPAAGLLFIDFHSGDLLYLTGRAEVLWDHPDLADFSGALRGVRFRLDHGRRVRAGLPIRWTPPEPSPRLEGTGTWLQR